MYLLLLSEHGLLDFSHSDRLDRLLLFSVEVTHLKMHLSVLILILIEIPSFIPALEGSDSLWKGFKFSHAQID